LADACGVQFDEALRYHVRMLKWLANLINPEPPDPEAILGPRGENAAAKYLRGLGYRIITRNFKTELGEIDIIARDGGTLVFVEVKTRSDESPAPEEQINDQKRHQITKAAKLYLSRYGVPQPPARFDVVAIVWPTGRQPQIRHHPNAFTATY
jgi:putative endonuclease